MLKIYKTMVYFSDDTHGNIYKVDTIEYEGKYWLVPEWLESPQEGLTMPKRIILLETLQHQKNIGGAISDFVLNDGIPKAVFDGEQAGGIYIIIENPDIKIHSAGGVH